MRSILVFMSLLALLLQACVQPDTVDEIRGKGVDGQVDATPPGNVTGISVVAAEAGVTISWTNPLDADFKGVRIVYATTAATLNAPNRGSLGCSDCKSPITITDLNPGITYHFRVYSYDNSYLYSGGVATSGVPASPTANSVCSGAFDIDCLQIATFNIERFDANTTDERKAQIAAIIQDSGLDIIALQEISNNPATLEDLVNRFMNGGSANWGFHIGSYGGAIRPSVLYRKSVVDTEQVYDLDAASVTGGMNPSASHWQSNRIPLHVQFKLKAPAARANQTFRLLVIHFKAFQDPDSCNKRQAQVDDINTWINAQTPASNEFILAGDFNDEIGAGPGICSSIDTLNSFESNASLQFLTTNANGFFNQDTSKKYTNIPFVSTIDHLLVTTPVAGRLNSTNGDGHTADWIPHLDRDISDHMPAVLWYRTY